jgi:hypothetical protein
MKARTATVSGLVLSLAIGVLAAGCDGGSSSPSGRSRSLDLPPQGILSLSARTVTFTGLDGHVYARLKGFTLYSTKPAEAVPSLEQQFPRLYDTQGHVYMIDPAGKRLLSEKLGRFPLVAGASFSYSVNFGHCTGPISICPPQSYTTSIRSHGRLLPFKGPDLRIEGGRYLAQRGKLYDLVSGKLIDSGDRYCVPAGGTAKRVFAVCSQQPIAVPNKFGKKTPSWAPEQLLAFASDGSVRRIVELPLVTQAAFLSPDGRFVAVTLAHPNLDAWAAIIPVAGGRARYVTGQALGQAHVAPKIGQSMVLGWAADNRLVVSFAPAALGYFAGGGPVYSVDPSSLQRRLIAPSGIEMWNPLPR